MTPDLRDRSIRDLFCCPFPSAVNPHAAAIDSNTTRWLLEQGLVGAGASLDRWSRSRYGWLPARCHPDRPVDQVGLASDWNAWLFVLDDRGDATGLGTSPTQMAALTARLLDVLASESGTDLEAPERGDGLESALADLRRRFLEHAPEDWLPRFAASCGDYFDALAWEATNRATGRVPDVEEYVAMRRHSGAVACSMRVGELTEGIRLPPELHADPTVVALRHMANNVVCWQNDVLSATKELAIGEFHNYVAVLMHHRGMSRDEATGEVVARHDKEVADFDATAARLSSRDGQADAQLAALATMLRCWMRGNLDWSLECGRYGNAPGNPSAENPRLVDT
jgi:5-epi-alpha-selinene synthase